MKRPHRRHALQRRGCCRGAGVAAHCWGASLSVPASATDCRISGRRSDRHHRTPDRTVALRSSGSAILRRQPARCRQQYRRRGDCARARRRSHVVPGERNKRGQRDAVREAQFRFRARHRCGCHINRIPVVLTVRLAFPAKTVSDLIAYARANPGKLNVATPPKGTAPYMAAELFKATVGLDITLIPYRGDAPAVTDLLGGQVPAAFGGISSWIEQVRAGKVRALAVASAERLEMLPEVPTIGDTLPGYEASGWCGIVAPKDTPSGGVQKSYRGGNRE